MVQNMPLIMSPRQKRRPSHRKIAQIIEKSLSMFVKFQIQCEDVWFLRQIRKLCARIQAHRKGGGGEAAMENYHDSAAEMLVR